MKVNWKSIFHLLFGKQVRGTQSILSVNEVISNRAHVLLVDKLGEGKYFIHPMMMSINLNLQMILFQLQCILQHVMYLLIIPFLGY